MAALENWSGLGFISPEKQDLVLPALPDVAQRKEKRFQ